MPFKKPAKINNPPETIPFAKKKTGEILILTFMFLLILPQLAFAYIDLGSGSYFLQLLLAALFGALYVVKVFWANIKLFFRSLLPGKKRS